jgi:hypothetical protein
MKESRMEDKDIVAHINEIAADEHRLWEKESKGELSGEERDRLTSLGVQLDQAYDLLHQRRAKRNAGENPDDAHVRDAETVEGYLG